MDIKKIAYGLLLLLSNELWADIYIVNDKAYPYFHDYKYYNACNPYCIKFGSQYMPYEWINPLYKAASGQNFQYFSWTTDDFQAFNPTFVKKKYFMG